MKTNILSQINHISQILACISQPVRMQILLSMESGEACVCHLEVLLEMSQASISQHLMILRKNGLVTTRRVGRHIFYSLSNPDLLSVFKDIAGLYGIKWSKLQETIDDHIKGCTCPKCDRDSDMEISK